MRIFGLHRVLLPFSIISLLPFPATSLNIILSNDDGWAELNIRTFFYKLTALEHSVVISAPAEDQSNKGSLDAPPRPVKHGCQFHSCRKKSPAIGANRTGQSGRFNYVNSYPVTAMRYGLEVLAPYFFDEAQPTSPSAWNAPSTYHTDIALSGPNLGANAGLKVFISGTVGAAVEAARMGYPAIAFSGTTGKPRAWYADIDEDGRKSRYVGLYANWAANVTDTLTYAGFGEGQQGVYMPKGTWLNVNFPNTDGDTDGDGDEDQGRLCEQLADVRFVLTRIHTAESDEVGDGTGGKGSDIEICANGGRLPLEETVLEHPGCYATISLGNATNKLDASLADQKVVFERLRTILTCLPRNEDQDADEAPRKKVMIMEADEND